MRVRPGEETGGRKQQLAGILARTRLTSVLMSTRARLLGPHVRAVNYHDVPRQHGEAFEAQLRWLAERFSDVGPAELDAVLSGNYRPERPGLLISFDDGLRSAADVAAPLLEEHGFTGWFMVPAGFVDCPVADQVQYAREHDIQHRSDYPDGRLAMSWDELNALSKRHVVTCHGMTHRRLAASLSAEELDLEICAAKRALTERLGAPVEGFTWVGGEEWSYSSAAARVIREAGFRYAFMTNNAPITARTDPFQLQRTNLEAWFPLDVVGFQLCGLMDALYLPKRRRVNTLTAS